MSSVLVRLVLFVSPFFLVGAALAASPSAETLRLLRTVVAPMLAEVYPQFAARVFGAAVSLPEPEK